MNQTQHSTSKLMAYAMQSAAPSDPKKVVVARQIDGLRAVLKRLSAANSVTLDGVTQSKISQLGNY